MNSSILEVQGQGRATREMQGNGIQDRAGETRGECQRLATGVGDGDVEGMVLMLDLAEEIDAAIAEAVKGLRTCGYSWAEVGSRVGINRQAAQQRWGQP